MATTRPTKLMLIDADHIEEQRIAIVNRDEHAHYSVEDFKSQRHDKLSHRGNIILGVVTKNQPSLNASFIDIGATRHGFLPEKEIADNYIPKRLKSGGERPRVDDILEEGQRVLVQIDKDQRGNKGAALTTQISLPGCYLVLMPNNPSAGGISRRIPGDERQQLKDTISQLNVPDQMGLIVRTAGVGKSLEELEWDLSILLKQWAAIQSAADAAPSAPRVIYHERDFVLSVIRDYLRKDIEEILINNEVTYERFVEQVKTLRPDLVNRIKMYREKHPLFSRYYIEKQIATAYQRQVRLPSGGSIVIDHTEALVSIDINSSRAVKHSDIEATAFHTNSEAAKEIATQLRLRDLGGLIVIDFIDMLASRNQREVENTLRDALRPDRARVQIGKIDRFGLLNMSRQRLHPSLKEFSHELCPRCSGQGTIRGIEPITLAVIRLIEDEAIRHQHHGKSMRIIAQLPVDVATYMLNEKRQDVSRIEEQYNIHILIVPNANIETPKYKLECFEISKDEGLAKASYKLVERIDSEGLTDTMISTSMASEAALENFMPSPEKKEGFMKRFFGNIIGGREDEEEELIEEIKKPEPKKQETRHKPRSHAGGRGRGGRDGGGRDGGGRDGGGRDGGGRDGGGRDGGGRDGGGRDGGGRDGGGSGSGGQRRRSASGGRHRRGDRTERSDRGDQAHRGERSDHGNRAERSDHGNRGERSDHGNRGERSDHGNRGERSDHGNRGERSDHGNQVERSDHGNRGERGGNHKRRPHDQQQRHHAKQDSQRHHDAQPKQTRDHNDEFAKQFDEFASEHKKPSTSTPPRDSHERNQSATPQVASTETQATQVTPPPSTQETFSAKDAGLNRDWDDVTSPTTENLAPEVAIQPAEEVKQQKEVTRDAEADAHKVDDEQHPQAEVEAKQPEPAEAMDDLFQPEQHARPYETGQKDQEDSTSEKTSPGSRHPRNRGRGRARRGRKH